MKQREYGLAIIYLLFGLIGLIGALSYPMGTFSRMGAGYLPAAISALLLGFSAVSFLRGYRAGEPVHVSWGRDELLQARSIGMLLLALCAFTFGIRALGLIPSVMALMLLGAMSSAQFKWDIKAFTGMTLLASFFSVIFVKLLGLNLTLIRIPF